MTKTINGKTVTMSAKIPDEHVLECGFLLMELDASRNLPLTIDTVTASSNRTELELLKMLEKEFENIK